MSKWNDKPISSIDDHDELERRAAVHQFGPGGLARSAADARAYAEYKHDQHARAAAHHIQASQDATSYGDRETGEKHKSLYDMHIAAMGKKGSMPPIEVRQYIQTNRPHGKAHKFKEHLADKLLGS